MSKFQVTFSRDDDSNRKFDEVGKFESIDEARNAAKAKVEGYFGKPMNREAFYISQETDKDFEGCEDWFVAALGKDSKAVIVAINCLPLVSKGASTKEPYDSGFVFTEIGSNKVVGILANNTFTKA